MEQAVDGRPTGTEALKRRATDISVEDFAAMLDLLSREASRRLSANCSDGLPVRNETLSPIAQLIRRIVGNTLLS